jgi:hypothetical protein
MDSLFKNQHSRSELFLMQHLLKSVAPAAHARIARHCQFASIASSPCIPVCGAFERGTEQLPCSEIHGGIAMPYELARKLLIETA